MLRKLLPVLFLLSASQPVRPDQNSTVLAAPERASQAKAPRLGPSEGLEQAHIYRSKRQTERARIDLLDTILVLV